MHPVSPPGPSGRAGLSAVGPKCQARQARKGLPLTCCPSCCVSGWTGPSPLAGACGKYWGPSGGAGPFGWTLGTLPNHYQLIMPDQTPSTLQPSSPGDGVSRPSSQFCPHVFFPQFFLELHLGVRQLTLNVSSATACVTFRNSLTSLKLSVLVCEMEIKMPIEQGIKL